MRDIYERFAAGEGARTHRRGAEPRGHPVARVRSRDARTAGRRRPCAPCWSGRCIAARSSTAGPRRPTAASSASAPQRHARRADRRARGDVDRVATSPRCASSMPTLAARVDARGWTGARATSRRSRRAARVPERAHGKYLLSGGMLVCPTCGGHFEARKSRRGRATRHVYICCDAATEAGRLHEHAGAADRRDRRRPCSSIVEGEVLGTRFIEELLALVDRATGRRRRT